MYIYIFFLNVNRDPKFITITRWEFDRLVGPSAATYYYNWRYTYGVHGPISVTLYSAVTWSRTTSFHHFPRSLCSTLLPYGVQVSRTTGAVSWYPCRY